MNTVVKIAQAGTMESNDIMITVAPAGGDNAVTIELESIVQAQYGEAIRATITETIRAQQVSNVYVKAVDRGALDCTIRARMLAALARAGVELKEARF